MKQFILLVQKDLRLTKWVTWIAGLILFSAGVTGYLFDNVSIVIGVGFVTFLYFPPLYMVMNFSKEWKYRLLLQMPQSGKILLAAKLVAEMISFLTLAFLALIGLLIGSHLPNADFSITTLSELFLILKFSPFVLIYGINGGLLGGITNLSTRFAQSYFKKGYNWFGILSTFITVYFMTGFTNTDVYTKLFHAEFIPSFVFQEMGNKQVIYSGDFLYSGMIICILFFLSSWLLDKKLNV
ncbi:hypothetical protein [Pseudalkalibacillus decolorationis]|uniref:hypothetical protein n=1 Tax=Pseudalkalibacillus decolorationis TaxID=163879 RepID=UPI002148AB4E|nr:hypothetical protein [Pseudalkalibacillus decolorationis]